MAIRQLRHLSEKPSDFFRLPVFIIVSTFFLMPIRVLGFFRMGHASGWGTRAGAYAGGDAPTELAAVPVPPSAPRALSAQPGGESGTTATLVRETTLTATANPTPTTVITGLTPSTKAVAVRRRRRPNPLAAVPYLIGIAILALEAMFLV
jgi:hypothetical protein